MAIQDSVEGYIEIQTQAEMDCYFDSVSGFHNGLIKEVHLINDAYIDKNLSMVCGLSTVRESLFNFNGKNHPLSNFF